MTTPHSPSSPDAGDVGRRLRRWSVRDRNRRGDVEILYCDVEQFRHDMQNAADLLDSLSQTIRERTEHDAQIAESYLLYGGHIELAERVGAAVRKGERICPYPISGDDGTAECCIRNGNCGCDERSLAKAGSGKGET